MRAWFLWWCIPGLCLHRQRGNVPWRNEAILPLPVATCVALGKLLFFMLSYTVKSIVMKINNMYLKCLAPCRVHWMCLISRILLSKRASWVCVHVSTCSRHWMDMYWWNTVSSPGCWIALLGCQSRLLYPCLGFDASLAILKACGLG